MAGRPQARALAAELERRTRELFEDVEHTSLDFVTEWYANGRTGKQLALDISLSLGFEITYAQMIRHLNNAFGESKVETDLDAARVRASHALAEEAIEIVDAPAFSTQDVARAASRAKSRQWMAERYNPARFGVQRGAQVTISIGTMHLDALRSRNMSALAKVTEPAVLESGSTDTSIEDAQVVD